MQEARIDLQARRSLAMMPAVAPMMTATMSPMLPLLFVVPVLVLGPGLA